MASASGRCVMTHEDWAEKKIEEKWDRIEELETAMRECSSRLDGLSMGTEGHMRAQICKANNFLRRALGKGLHSIAANWQEDDTDYRRLIGDAETMRGSE